MGSLSGGKLIGGIIKILRLVNDLNIFKSQLVDDAGDFFICTAVDWCLMRC